MSFRIRLVVAPALLVCCFVFFGLMRGHVSAAVPANVQNALVSGCPSIPPGGSAATGFIYPNPSTVSSSDGGTNFYSVLHVCAGSAVWGVGGTLRMYNVSRTSGSGWLGIGDTTFPYTTAPNSGNGTGSESSPVPVTFGGLSQGNNCWSFEMDMSITGWQLLNTGINYICINYVPPDNPPVGTALANCSSIWGYAHDPDGTLYSGQRALILRVHIYIDGRFWRSISAGNPPNHDNFSVAYPYNDTSSHRVQVYAINPTFGGPNPLIGDIVVPACDRPPIGSFDNAVCNPSTGVASLTGWAFDPDFPTAPIEIHLYADGPAGTGTWDGIRHKADRSRPDVNAAYPATGNSPHGFNIDVSQYSDAYTHTFYLYAIGTSSSSGRQDVNRANTPLGSRTIGPCRPPTCTVSAFPTDPQVNQQFSLSLNYTYSPGGRGLAIAPVGRVGLSNPANSAPFPFLSSRNGQGHDFPGYSKNTIGRFPVYGSLALNGYTVQCLNNGDVNRGVRVVDKPYLVQVNGDVASGTGIAGPQSCVGWNSSSANSGTITTWDGGISGGPGTNLATYALAVINGFASAQTPSGSFGGPSPPKNLSFANSSGTYGGSFGGGIPCPTDYYSKKPAGLSAPAGTVTNSNMDYSTTGNITLAGGGLSGGNRSAIYVRGNVYISSNITLSSGATIDTLSSFYLVVQGNIYIAPSVTQLDGVYVAQPGSGGGGLIYTCSNNFNPPTVAQLNGVCKNQLTVNGAFIAKETKLYRSYGTLITGTPAEIFNYTPATWLVAPSSIGEETGSSYDAITSLPPVL